MSPEKQRIAIAEFCGWQGVPVKQNSFTKNGTTFWRSQCPEGLSKYSSLFESSCALRWLKKPDGKPFLVKVGPITVNNKDEYSLNIALEYSKDSGYGSAPKEVEPSLKAFIKYLPDYLKDLNSMHEAKQNLNPAQRRLFIKEAGNFCEVPFDAYNLTAAQEAEILLRVIGKWEN